MRRRNLSLLLLVSFLTNTAWADSTLNLTKGVTAISNEVYSLHMMALYVCTAIGIVVFGIMFWSIAFHRKSKGAKAADFHESTKIEMLWTAIPVVILISMAIPATSTLIAMEDNSNADITIQVTGSQWKWHYKYFDEDIEFYSVLSTPREQYENQIQSASKSDNYLLEVDKPLVIPVNKKVRFLLTSDDVIHSWWVPAFAVKQDANPGFINEAWTRVDKPGIYRGQCAELCGKDHGFMPIVVEVLSEQDYQQWIIDQQQLIANAAAAEQASLNASASMDELMQLGESTYTAHCAACHQPTGLGLPPAFPALKGSKIATSASAIEHINIVFNGKAGTGMQGYGKQLSLKEVAAVVTFERNAWGNNTGDMIQAADVKQALQQVNSPDNASPINSSTTTSKAKNTDELTTVHTLESLMAEGEKVYLASCAACHQVNGTGMPPAFPALKDSVIALGDIAQHIDMVVNGSRKNPAMAAFYPMLSKTQIAAVITYERNAWGNNTGDIIQPADIDAASTK